MHYVYNIVICYNTKCKVIVKGFVLYLTDYLVRNAEETPDKPAIIFEDVTYTWAHLNKQVEAAAQILVGMVPSDKQSIIGILLPNSPEFVVAYLAIVHVGHIAMPLDPNFKKPEVVNVVEQMEPFFTITDTTSQVLFNEFQKTILFSELSGTVASQATEKYLRINPSEQYVSMLFTSGTTGNPKATPYSHSNHQWNINAVSDLWKWTSEDTLLISLALSHWHGLCVGLTGALMHGNTIYLHERFEPEATLQTLSTGDISLFMHVPIAYSKIVEHNLEAQYDLSKVRLCISGSSFLPPAIWQQFKQRFNQEILERYGASEMGFLTSNLLSSRIPGCVGKPLPGVTIKIQKDGEIAMKSPGLFNGYWKNQEATDEHITKDGLWLSGDIAKLDEEGRVHLKGRVQEKMKKFGYTVYPRDVEWSLMQNPHVTDAIVMSIQSDQSLSDQFVYFVVADISEEEITEYCKKNMPNYWRPDIIKILKAIPRTGRASKPALKELRALVEG